ncbi:hypothetical protein [Clostridium sp. CF012]|uniref:hypothetical protein n=1 Tax=Clostridium sp. CF012 TaxID=2843319 RepID=UPI001C0C5E47|nr:hypothetical protein [Clostridium sp. CF012]MBU3146611.1 hypothetical protein [Clostridium sp. CF012]
MKVRKKVSPNGGCNISVEIAGREWNSYWSAPGISVDHAGLRYLTDRYPIISTEKRAAEFKRQYKNLWIEVSEEQLKLMHDALGLGYSKKPYRNRFQTHMSDLDWNALVEKGLAIKSENKPNKNGFTWFWCSKVGAEFVTDKKISDEGYKDL